MGAKGQGVSNYGKREEEKGKIHHVINSIEFSFLRGFVALTLLVSQ